MALVGWKSSVAMGTEGGASVYPIGVETVFPGMTPPPGVTMFAEFNMTYRANSLLDEGHSSVPGFKLAVNALAPKVVHNWGIHLLGGNLVSAVATPVVNEHLELPSFKGTKTGFGNPELGVAYIAYNHRDWHWWYGLDVYTPAPVYHRTDVINIGQHNFATVPVGAFTYLPDRGRAELSSRFQYIVNYTDSATHYRSGNEFTWEYTGMLNVTKKLAVGANGYLYKQTTGDLQNGVMVAGGEMGRDFAIGPPTTLPPRPPGPDRQVPTGHDGAEPPLRKRVLGRVGGSLGAPKGEVAGSLVRVQRNSWRQLRKLPVRECPTFELLSCCCEVGRHLRIRESVVERWSAP